MCLSKRFWILLFKVTIIDIIYLDNCLVTEIRSQNKNCVLICIYLSFPKPKSQLVWKFLHDVNVNYNLMFFLTIYVTNFLYAHLSHYILMIVAKDDRKMILQNLASRNIESLASSAGYKEILKNLIMLCITPCHVLMLYFVLIKE